MPSARHLLQAARNSEVLRHRRPRPILPESGTCGIVATPHVRVFQLWRRCCKLGAMKTQELGPSLLAALATVPDPRSRDGRRHPLPAILALATAAMLSGARGRTGAGMATALSLAGGNRGTHPQLTARLWAGTQPLARLGRLGAGCGVGRAGQRSAPSRRGHSRPGPASAVHEPASGMRSMRRTCGQAARAVTARCKLRTAEARILRNSGFQPALAAALYVKGSVKSRITQWSATHCSEC